MRTLNAKVFTFSAGALLSLTALAKIMSASGAATMLHKTDPIIGISYQHLFWVVGAIELVVSFVCFFADRVGLRAGLVAWLATNFAAYRISLYFLGYKNVCPCLGHITDALHIRPQIADFLMKLVLVYLLLGSYAILFQFWQKKRKASRSGLSMRDSNSLTS